MGQPDSSKYNKRKICCEHSRHGALRQKVSQPISAARFLSEKTPLRWVFSALLMFAIQAPARADKPCSGGDDDVARPIAATLQSNASAFNPSGHFEVTMQSGLPDQPITDIYVRHSMGSRELFRAITRLQSIFHAVVVGRLPASEGLGFSLQLVDGGSGLTNFCTYGFRFQNGVVSYRTLAASAETHVAGVVAGKVTGTFAGDVTDWKSVPRAALHALSPQQVEQLNATIDTKLKQLASTQPSDYFFSTDNWLDVINAAFRGDSRLREQYDGYYFGGLVYRQLAVKRLVGARQLVGASKGAAAQHAIAESDRYLTMMGASWSAASLAAIDSVSNSAEIQRLASTIYSASKITVLCGSSAVLPAAAAAFERVYSVTDFGIDLADVGFSEAARRAVVDKSTTWLIEKAGIKNNCAQLLATDRLFFHLSRRVEAIVRTDEFKRALGDAIAASLASAQRLDAVPIANLIVRQLTRGTAVALPQVGTREMQLITLGYPFSKLIEVIDSTSAGSTHQVSGRRGEETWTVLGDPAPMSIAAGKSRGLRAAVFENRTSNQCAIVFGGTDDLNDMLNNIAQWAGTVVPPQYEQGADFAVRAVARCGGRKIVIAGHSLGGGIAQHAYLQTGSSHLTYTFNPAGLGVRRWFADLLRRPTVRGPSGNVVAFIAHAYDPSSATDLGRDVVSLVPGTYKLGVQVQVPVYSWSPTPHILSELAEGLGIQRDYCLKSETCRWTVAAATEMPDQKSGSAAPSASLLGEFPPMPFIDYGYQVDLVTGDWRLRRVHTLFADIGDNPRAIGTLNAGEPVMADQIAIRTFNYETYEVNEPKVERFWNHITQQGVLKIVDTPVALRKGDRIVVLSYFGEGECRVWFKGKTYVAECPPIVGAVDNQITKRKNEIWARVVTSKGLRGYLRDPDASGMSKHE